jgi:aminomethyltransferase
MGEFSVRGRAAGTLLEKLIPTGMQKLAPGRCMYSCFTNERGGVVDDIFIFMVSPEEYYLVVNAATTRKDLDWMRSHNSAGADVIDVSDATSKIDIQGPRSSDILGRAMGDVTLGRLERFQFAYSTFEGRPVMVSCTGYTGEHGFELFTDNGAAPRLWRRLLEEGRGDGIRPAGLGARDTLRLEAAYSLYGHELSDDITPVEGGLRWLVTSGEDYIGRDVLADQKERGAPRELVCFELTGKGVPRERCGVIRGGEEIGATTSGGYSPTFKKGIGMALVKSGKLTAGDEFAVIIRGSEVPAVAVKRPFYTYHG